MPNDFFTLEKSYKQPLTICYINTYVIYMLCFSFLILPVTLQPNPKIVIMKKIILICIMLIMSACSTKPETPVLTKNEVFFEKEGGNTTIYGTNGMFYVFDKNLGYKESDIYSNGGLESQILDCGWVVFEVITIYGGSYHYTDPKIRITVTANENKESRNLSIKFNNILNGKESGTTTLTVHQKGF